RAPGGVLQVRRRLPVALAARAVTARAARVSVDLPTTRDRVWRTRRRRARVRQWLRLRPVEEPGEREDAGGDLFPLLLGGGREGGHPRAGDTVRDGAQKVGRRGRLPRRRRAELERALREVARGWIEGAGLRPGAVAALAVTAAALAEVGRPARPRIGLGQRATGVRCAVSSAARHERQGERK